MNKKYPCEFLVKAKKYIVDNLDSIKKHGVLLVDNEGKFFIDYSLHKEYGVFIASYDFNTVGFNPIFYYEVRKCKGRAIIYFYDYDTISREFIDN